VITLPLSFKVRGCRNYR